MVKLACRNNENNSAISNNGVTTPHKDQTKCFRFNINNTTSRY